MRSPINRWLVVAALAAVFGLRGWRADQPILEGFVGRQVPTAMVAHNLARGSGFFAPQLDTGPHPNLFLVEPPIYAQTVAWLAGVTGFPRDQVGRVVSAAAATLAAWGVYGLVRRRRGRLAAIGALIAFAAFPVTIRYGRAVQPDAFAMGLSVAGLRCLDGRRRWVRAAGWALVAVGIAQKVTWAVVLVPLVLDLRRCRARPPRILALACLLPAAAWYGFVALRLWHPSAGSAASIDNATNWAARLASSGLLDPHRVVLVARDLVVRSFTPLGFGLSVVGFAARRRRDRLWTHGTLAAGCVLLVLFGKLHHDYYWLLLAPAMAASAGIGMASVARGRLAAPLAVALVAMGLVQSRSTWTTPDEWRDALELAGAVGRSVPRDGVIIAPEAIIHLGERRGCRLEWEPGAVRRAANEWRPVPAFEGGDPSGLVDFYRRASGARFFADLEPRSCEPARRALHDRLRRDPRARVLDDRPGRYLLVDLDGPDRSQDP